MAKKKKFLNIENEEVQEFRPDHRVYNQVCVAAHLRDIRLLVSDYYTNLQVIEVIEDFESADQSIFGECTQTILALFVKCRECPCAIYEIVIESTTNGRIREISQWITRNIRIGYQE